MNRIEKLWNRTVSLDLAQGLFSETPAVMATTLKSCPSLVLSNKLMTHFIFVLLIIEGDSLYLHSTSLLLGPLSFRSDNCTAVTGPLAEQVSLLYLGQLGINRGVLISQTVTEAKFERSECTRTTHRMESSSDRSMSDSRIAQW